MLRSILLYFLLVLYMLYSLFKKMKLERLKKTGREEEIQLYIYKCVKDWADFIIKAMGIKVNINGIEKIPGQSCLFVSNHQGFLDIPIIIASVNRSVGFIAKKEIKKVGIISYWMEQIKCVFMDRNNIRESIKSINEGINILKNGHSMIIFPEGTRSRGSKMGEFKKGSFKLALKSMVPIVPIAINGSYKLREGNPHENLRPGTVDFTICDPIYTENLSKEQRDNLAGTIKEKISEALNN
ncbi:MAG: 1-acyl-sn-glycerol-3-phosphate acyltransferase [Clostridium sp.]|uniref:lysophospholipid acyltransferase family protein n=1 Tax=Clostridium sp. TaxID=1506 RepID=UPI0025BE2134|nr:lysophospholipid acyltransferase family protein [Clostridium sp.]MCH3964986.1 1-acyl-sn-glycerol-3-phosphate acyltransferase [Clostridium sp.]MCI1716520.1 1-acyl-sn-glycerol-3-phosphate acyltransferase [Clostridium sp.]MCI1800998.1 1-acyl-sn-glycerol-3-phosphate acyltransferase [Clostridium sp.]MCI1814697.1 1-acyl-sn-glycerol-3-phosphate acyltransferase [Clostridium sp.]MCI1871745.1 1-acyl-sn-glycerol-3-phosphate acyltransferase [Clostridium sp.]